MLTIAATTPLTIAAIAAVVIVTSAGGGSRRIQGQASRAIRALAPRAVTWAARQTRGAVHRTAVLSAFRTARVHAPLTDLGSGLGRMGIDTMRLRRTGVVGSGSRWMPFGAMLDPVQVKHTG